MIGCRYTGSFRDHSGYGMANRNFIAALHLAGVDVSTECVIQVPERSSFGWTEELCKQLEGREINFKVKIIHLTPDTYPRYKEKGKYHIGHLPWETSLLPKEWISSINEMNEIWTMTPWQVEVMKNSGIKIPVRYFPEAVDASMAQKPIAPFGLDFKGYLFYSIFQWIERKNPRALLTNYWKAFEGKKDVALLVKTYGQNYSDEEFDRIKKEVFEWKKQLNLSHYPKVFLVRKLLTTEEVWRLHETGDCFVSASRGEGWGVPQVEAMLRGKPVVSISRTGVFDLLSPESFYGCGSTKAEVTRETPIKWYAAPQEWLEISSADLIEQMLKVYNSQEEARLTGQKAQREVTEKFNYHTVGLAMKSRLEEIEREINAKT